MYGGKADSLLKLQNLGFNVPKFFIITEDDYKTFLEDNKILDKVREYVAKKDVEPIKKLIMEGNINKELATKIETGLHNLKADLFSVRSSAANEDGKEKSFAGQYDTFLNVSKKDIVDRIKRCWLSLYSDNVRSYANDIDYKGMNVIVQCMIPADYAGVAFSVDPTSSTGNYSLIELTKGLGEDLVSGRVTPIKYLMRRETAHIDLCIGSSAVDESTIVNLEQTILEIERQYNCPVDVEYAILDGEIYILQTRPITTKNEAITSYNLAITRPMSLIETEIYFRGEYEGIKTLTRGLYYFKPLFIYNSKNKNSDIYYDEVDLEEDPRLMYYYMDLDFDKIKGYYDEVIENDITKIEEVISLQKELDVNEFVECLVRIFPFVSLGQIAGRFEDISVRLKDFLTEFRFIHDTIFHEATHFLLEAMRKDLPCEYSEYIDFLTLSEVKTNLPRIEELRRRQNGYIYFGALQESRDLDEWLTDNHISLTENDDDSLLKGDVAYSKTVQGKVCVIYSEDDFAKFSSGDIIVTPMTVPKFTPIIQKAVGIITDEGGVTCHASIIARELKIACVVGCRNATKLLKDGDRIEIDGATGMITKI